MDAREEACRLRPSRGDSGGVSLRVRGIAVLLVRHRTQISVLPGAGSGATCRHQPEASEGCFDRSGVRCDPDGLVRESPRPAYVFPSGSEDSAALKEALEMAGISFQEIAAPGFVVMRAD